MTPSTGVSDPQYALTRPASSPSRLIARYAKTLLLDDGRGTVLAYVALDLIAVDRARRHGLHTGRRTGLQDSPVQQHRILWLALA
jgi:hypothetical protein